MASPAPAGTSTLHPELSSLTELLRPLREALALVAGQRAQDEARLGAVLGKLESALAAALRVEPPAPASPSTAPSPSAPAVSPPAIAKESVLVAQSIPASTTAPAPSTAVSRGAVSAAAATAAQTGLTSRARLIELHTHLQELDRLVDPDAVLDKLWSMARTHGLRALVLHEAGKSLVVARTEGFATFEGERHRRLGKAAVPFDEDNLFGILAAERAVYSGPRPASAFPVDLALLLGKRTPGWVLAVPVPMRNRWGRFLYVEAEASELEAALMLDALAQCAIRQLRGAQYHRHTPAERTRAALEAALAERRKWAQRATGRPSEPAPAGRSGSNAAGSSPPAGTAGAGVLAVGVGAVDAPRHAASDAAAEGAAVAASPTPLPEPDPAIWGPLRVARVGRDPQGGGEPPAAGEILAKVGDLPAMPHVTARALALLQNSQTTVQQVQELISQDQALTAKLMHVANSSLYGGSRDVSTIGEAVMRLGFRQIRSWMMATAARNVFLKNETTYVLRILWQHSVIAALAGQLIGARSRKIDPDEAFLGGLMHNIGLLLLARNHPEAMAELHTRASQEAVGYHEMERRLLGYDHADLGGVVLHAWRLGDKVTDAVTAHHRLADAGSARPFAAVINLAEELALRMGRGPTETCQNDLSQSEAAQALGLDAEGIQQLTDQLARLLLDSKLLS